MNRRRTDLASAVLLIVVATLLFSDVLFLGNNFYFRDLFQYHFPLKRVVRDTIAGGEFPWWQRRIAGGQPMAANPAYEIFYPPQWLIFIGTFPFGFALHIVFHVYVALLGMYAFLRSLSMRVEAALFGALSFGLSGFLLGTVTNLPTFFVWSWAGVVGWGFVRAVRTGRIATAAFALAMPLLVGEPMALAQMLLLITAATLWSDRKAFGRVIAAMLLAAAIAAVQILPALDLARDSSRSRGFRYDVVTDFSMPPVRPLELFAPRLFGLLHPEAHQYWGFGLFHRHEPYLLSLYCGVAVVIFALTGAVLRCRGWNLTLLLAAISYVLAIGDATPIFRWIWNAGLRSIRYPEKFAAMGLIALIIFATAIADRLLRGDRDVRRIAVVIASAIAVALGIAGGLWTPELSESFFRLPKSLVQIAAAAPSALVSSAAIAALWALVIWRAGTQRVWIFVAFALVLFDVSSFSNAAVARMPRRFFTPPAITSSIRGAAFHAGEWTSASVADRYSSVSPGWTARNGLRPFSAVAWGISSVLDADFDETDLLPTHDLIDTMMRLGNAGNPRWRDNIAAISNVGTILDYRPFSSAVEEAGGDVTKIQPLVVRNVPAQGTYFFAKALLPEAAVATVDAHGVAFVTFPPFTPASAHVVRARETSSSATVDVEAVGRTFLVATVTRHKNWRATIDGLATPLLPANFAYQGLIVPGGRHRIEMHYRDPLVVWGAVVSAIAILFSAFRPFSHAGRRSLGSLF